MSTKKRPRATAPQQTVGQVAVGQQTPAVDEPRQVPETAALDEDPEDRERVPADHDQAAPEADAAAVASGSEAPDDEPAPEFRAGGASDTDGNQAETPDPEGAAEGVGAAWRRLLRMARPRATRANLLALGIAGIVGFAIATQVQQTNDRGLADLRHDELVTILADVDDEGTRLGEELGELEDTLDALRSGAGSEEAQKAAQRQLEKFQVLAGEVPVRGPGITLTITDPLKEVEAANLLDAVQELRNADAEAIQLGDVRVVADTYFTDTFDGIAVSGQPIEPPYVVTAIGDPDTLTKTLEIPGGVVETVEAKESGRPKATIQQHEVTKITALHEPEDPQYAQPVPEASATTED